MSPNETLFLESTQKIHREWVQHSSLVRFHVMDFPGQIDFFDPAFDRLVLGNRSVDSVCISHAYVVIRSLPTWAR